MDYYNINIKGVLKKDLEYKNMFEEISKLVNIALCMDTDLKKLHNTNTFKFYSFDGLAPFEKNGYKQFKIYNFNIKTADRVFAEKLKCALKDLDNQLLVITEIRMNTLKVKDIDTVFSVTPTISVIDRGSHWTKNDFSMDIIKENILSNTIKKYNSWFDTDIKTHDFIEEISLLNKKVIFIPYKKGIFLTNKFKIKVKKDKLSQEIARLIFVIGLLEKNSLGLGYCEFS